MAGRAGSPLPAVTVVRRSSPLPTPDGGQGTARPTFAGQTIAANYTNCTNQAGKMKINSCKKRFAEMPVMREKNAQCVKSGCAGRQQKGELSHQGLLWRLFRRPVYAPPQDKTRHFTGRDAALRRPDAERGVPSLGRLLSCPVCAPSQLVIMARIRLIRWQIERLFGQEEPKTPRKCQWGRERMGQSDLGVGTQLGSSNRPLFLQTASLSS